MRTADIAKRYLDYFAKHDHLIVPSASLISPNPTTLFHHRRHGAVHPVPDG